MRDALHPTIEEFAAEGFTHVECHCPRSGMTRQANQGHLKWRLAMNDKTAAFVRSFRVGEQHTVTMTLTRRRFCISRITCRWSPNKPTNLTKEEKRQYRSGRAAAVADAYGSMSGRIVLIMEI